MLPFFGPRFGNPSSVHRWGREARTALDEARERVARCLGASPDEIVFTSCGTEADNMALIGVWRAHHPESDQQRRDLRRGPLPGHHRVECLARLLGGERRS
jgi:cysteine sulfinate desulfinase/cysteine desulfurase-like protein